MDLVTTFANSSEFENAVELLNKHSLVFRTVSPAPGYERVGTSALVLDEETRWEMQRREPDRFMCAGWIDYHPSQIAVPTSSPAEYTEDVFGTTAIMVLKPCAADSSKLRTVAHISGDLTAAFPYANAVSPDAFYNVKAHTFTISEAHRIVTLHPRRIAMAKADNIVDAWRLLEALRIRFNDCWKRRSEIVPSLALRTRPPALEIYYRLPKLNCRQCGEPTCMAFAMKLWSGRAKLAECRPVFEADHIQLRDPLVEICAGLGVPDN